MSKHFFFLFLLVSFLSPSVGHTSCTEWLDEARRVYLGGESFTDLGLPSRGFWVNDAHAGRMEALLSFGTGEGWAHQRQDYLENLSSLGITVESLDPRTARLVDLFEPGDEGEEAYADVLSLVVCSVLERGGASTNEMASAFELLGWKKGEDGSIRRLFKPDREYLFFVISTLRRVLHVATESRKLRQFAFEILSEIGSSMDEEYDRDVREAAYYVLGETLDLDQVRSFHAAALGVAQDQEGVDRRHGRNLREEDLTYLQAALLRGLQSRVHHALQKAEFQAEVERLEQFLAEELRDGDVETEAFVTAAEALLLLNEKEFAAEMERLSLEYPQDWLQRAVVNLRRGWAPWAFSFAGGASILTVVVLGIHNGGLLHDRIWNDAVGGTMFGLSAYVVLSWLLPILEDKPLRALLDVFARNPRDTDSCRGVLSDMQYHPDGGIRLRVERVLDLLKKQAGE